MSLNRLYTLARGWIAREGYVDIIPTARLSGPMPWVIAIMVALTTVTLAAGLTLGNAVSVAKAEIAGGVTVQIIEPRSEIREAEAKRAVAKLKAMDSVEEVRLVSREEVDALLEPWLGSGIGDATDAIIPVPALIDVRLSGEASTEQVAGLGKQVQAVARSARVDAQSNWLRPVFDAMASLQVLAITLVVLLAFVLSAAVLLAARSALGANRNTIEIVHLLGGTDDQVAQVFQRSIGLDAAVGGVAGLGLAALTITILSQRFGELGAGLVANGALSFGDWLLLALVPILASILAMVTARFSVQQALRQML